MLARENDRRLLWPSGRISHIGLAVKRLRCPIDSCENSSSDQHSSASLSMPQGTRRSDTGGRASKRMSYHEISLGMCYREIITKCFRAFRMPSAGNRHCQRRNSHVGRSCRKVCLEEEHKCNTRAIIQQHTYNNTSIQRDKLYKTVSFGRSTQTLQ